MSTAELLKKLHGKSRARVVVLGAPADVMTLFAEALDGVAVSTRLRRSERFVVAFVRDADALARQRAAIPTRRDDPDPHAGEGRHDLGVRQRQDLGALRRARSGPTRAPDPPGRAWGCSLQPWGCSLQRTAHRNAERDAPSGSFAWTTTPSARSTPASGSTCNEDPRACIGSPQATRTTCAPGRCAPGPERAARIRRVSSAWTPRRCAARRR